MRRWTKATALVSLLLASSCAGLGDLGSLFEKCDRVGQNTFVRDTMKDIYLWYRELPDLDPAKATYDSPEAYLEAIRYQRYDTHFSFITEKAADTAYYSDSKFIGMGISSSQTSTTELRLSQVFPDSPASEAGLARGDFILTINGKSVADLISSGEIGNAFGPSDIGVSVDLVWRDMGGQQHSATLKKREVTIPTVSMTRVFALGNRRVGYILFLNFVRPSVDALDQAFAELGAQGVQELILDLRYNGGGMTSVALHLGGLIGGVRTKGEVFARFAHNDKNTSRDTTDRFEDPAQALDLPRLTVITTDGSASASEAVINGLEPFIPVTLVGDTTYGKPVGQYGFDFCEKVLYPVSFKLVNARNEGDYFDGIPVDCPAVDDLDHQLGDPNEASLAEALSFAATGSCSSRRAAAVSALGRRHAEIGKPSHRLDGWQQLIGAY